MEKSTKKNRWGCIIVVLAVIFLTCAAAMAKKAVEDAAPPSSESSAASSTAPDGIITTDDYLRVDKAQATKDNCEKVASYVDGFLGEQELYVIGYAVEWIGYYKYEDVYTQEEFEDAQTGGYYSYTGKISTGEVLTGRVRCYWGEGEDPVILNLTIERADGNDPIVEWDDSTMAESWKMYQEKADA